MKKVQDFFNKFVKDIDKAYFPDVKYYMDNENTAKVHRTAELFNNGVLGYSDLIERISKATGDTKKNIHEIASKYIEDFGDYTYNSKD